MNDDIRQRMFIEMQQKSAFDEARNAAYAYADQSLELFHLAVATLQPLTVKYPNVPQYRRELAAAMMAIGLFQVGVADYSAARGNLEAAFQLFRQLAAAFPNSQDYAWHEEAAAAAIAELDALPSSDE